MKGPNFTLDFNFDKQMDILSDGQLTQPDPTDIFCFQAAVKQSRDPLRPKGRPVAISKVSMIQFANFEIDTWFPAPYMEEQTHTKLFLCEHCLKCVGSEFGYNRHKKKCQLKLPPGDEIYRHENLSVFEVDGRKSTVSHLH